MVRALLTALPTCFFLTGIAAAAPQLYSQPFYQSPVHADPDDLLILGGHSLSLTDRVVYRAANAAQRMPDHPAQVPADSGPAEGIAPIISARGAPYQLLVRMPMSIDTRRAYDLWVVSAAGEWSNAARINDPRPLWFTPSRVYSTAPIAFLPRQIKVVGRNLLPGGLAELQVRLEGPQRHLLHKALEAAAQETLAEFTAKRALPGFIAPGVYAVEVSADGKNWIAVAGQSLTVTPDPPEKSQLWISSEKFGRCRPDDRLDDTECLLRALQAAAHNGSVSLGKGVWDLQAGRVVMETGTALHGQSAALTRIVRHDSTATAKDRSALITLLGGNEIRDITFADAVASEPGDAPRTILRLGKSYSTDLQPTVQAATVSDIVISRNVFERTNVAISDGGSPMRNLFITRNTFGDYRLALELGGNRFNMKTVLRIDDAVIAYNEFKPGSYLDVASRQGAMASELGAATRVDFSSNIADGADGRFLNSGSDAPGWRAAFFFHMNNNQEMLLISDNTVRCSGDKVGDGEAISLDNNANTFALPAASGVSGAAAQMVSIAGPLNTIQNQRGVDPSAYYADHWVRVVAGPGVGQARRITAYRIDPQSGEVRFSVAPSWDVEPVTGASKVTIAREFWQTLILANHIDQRRAPCRKANRSRPKGGNISVWAQSSDSVVAGNEQYDTDGILFQQAYGAQDPSCKECETLTVMPTSLDIRDNLIDGEYDWSSACSLSGIMGSYAVAPSARFAPPILNAGVSISHNRITHADGLYGGAIGIIPTWHRGPPGGRKPLVSGLVIHHNVITHITGPAPRAQCGYAQSFRAGIHLSGRDHLDATVLYMNRCEDVAKPLLDEASHTQAVCDMQSPHSCECRQ